MSAIFAPGAARRGAHFLLEMYERSVMSSLNELMSLEQERIAAEEQARASVARQADRDRQEAARRALEAEQERLRADAEQRARMEAMAAQQAEERQLKALRAKASKRALERALVRSGLAVALIAAMLGGVAYSSHEEARRRTAADQQTRRRIERVVAEQQAKIDELEAQTRRLQGAVARATHPEEVARMKAELERVASELRTVNDRPWRPIAPIAFGHPWPSAEAPEPPAPAEPKPCREGDPLCENVPE